MEIPAWVDQAVLTYGYWALFMATALECMGVPVPAETTLIAMAIYAGTNDKLNIGVVILAAAIGAILGDNAGYGIGYKGGYPLLVRIAHVMHISPTTLDRAQNHFARRGAITVFAGRFIAYVRIWAALLAGINRMRWGSFLLWNAAGGVLWATAYGILGYLLGHNLPLLGQVLGALDLVGKLVLIAILAVVISAWSVHAYRTRRQEGVRPQDPL